MHFVKYLKYLVTNMSETHFSSSKYKKKKLPMANLCARPLQYK